MMRCKFKSGDLTEPCAPFIKEKLYVASLVSNII